MAILLFFFSRFSSFLALFLVAATLTACSGLGGRARSAASMAIRDPWTWAPLAGAAMMATGDNDEKLSRWAKSETPVYGSKEAALDASDQYRAYASAGAWGVFFAAAPQSRGNWFAEKGMDAGGNLVGLAFARNTTGVLKAAAQRERPHNGPVRDSFPSAHSTDAFAHAALSRYYADDLRLERPWREGAKWATNAFAAATAWGRVEGGVHYPSDVLAGAAIANFTTRFFMELTAPNARTGWRVRPRTDEDGGIIIEIEKPL